MKVFICKMDTRKNCFSSDDIILVPPTLTFAGGSTTNMDSEMKVCIIYNYYAKLIHEKIPPTLTFAGSSTTNMLSMSQWLMMIKYGQTYAEVRFQRFSYTVSEENGTVSVCVDSGVTGGFETALIVSLTAEDGTTCKLLL